MPEGPEIQIACDKIARVLKGEKVVELSIPWEPLSSYQEQWSGIKITDLKARGKALLTYFETGDILYTHNQLYGRWVVRKNGKEPQSSRTLRLGFRTSKGAAFLYSATDLEVLMENELSTHKYLGALGPDILDPKTTTAKVVKRLQSKSFRNRQLAGLYLDQHFLAGPGNYLRSEILFCSQVHPKRKPSQLSVEALKRLAQTTLKISRRAYKTKGITTEASLEKRLKSEGERRRTRRHYAFGRAGSKCRVCEIATIEKIKVSSRSVFFCPVCQDASDLI